MCGLSVPAGDKIIVVCDSGGTLEGTPSLKYGKLSRSLIAAYFLKQNGYKVRNHNYKSYVRVRETKIWYANLNRRPYSKL